MINKKVLYGGVIMDGKEQAAIQNILDTNWWGLSEEGRKFEQEIAQVQGVKYAVFVNSGTSALDIAIRSLNLPKGSEVIVPACTFPTPIASIIREGLRPVVVDIDLPTYFISVSEIKKAITDKTSAILIVYAAGLVGELDEVLKLANKYNLRVIEDNCDGFGGTYKNRLIGSFGDASAISTHAAHIISTGEGGVMFTNDLNLSKIAYSLRDWGRINEKDNIDTLFSELPKDYLRFFYTQLGSNYKPLELQAAMGRVQLKKLKRFKELRQRNFNYLSKALASLKDEIILPKSSPSSDPCYFTFPIVLKNASREKMLQVLDKAQIEWRPILAGDISKQPGFKNHVKKSGSLPNSSKLIHDGFWVSVHPQHDLKTMRYIADTIKQGIELCKRF